jgi:hypothetical protein
VASTSSRRVGVGAVIVIVIIIAALALAKSRNYHFKPAKPAIGDGCMVRGNGFDVPLSTGQAGMAALIAGVAAHRSMPVRAVTIAYATALQESNLANLPFGDRDSVGVFQQRPSQGWGTRKHLLEPVYATTRFFAALAAVPRYQHLLVYQAAQDVQRSADGHAYSQYSLVGQAMAYGFTGHRPHDVWCWYGSGVHRDRRIAAADATLTRAFGHLRIRHVGDPVTRVVVHSTSSGWAIATWLVAHAGKFGIQNVSFAGYEWTAAHGQKGWLQAPHRRHAPVDRKIVAFG